MCDMKYLILIIIFAFQALYVNAQCNDKTKEQVDSLKVSIPYPKFNINDTLYIAFINCPEIGTDKITEKDIEVVEVKIINMKLCNDVGIPDSNPILCLGGTLPVEWQYQFIDTRIKSPKIKDCSKFYSEDRFSTSVIEAKKAIIEENLK